MSTERKSRVARGTATTAAKDDKTLTLKLVRSGICTPRDQKATLRSLGLRRIGQQVVRADHPAIRGMVLKVRHLVEVVKD
ncbi:MAG TPA: 50S ribosomal protein L30 [Thermoanaerobaculia bacterium]|nr:50S ribosomal protein L30 [Thermoanaerobaculia bacterium]